MFSVVVGPTDIHGAKAFWIEAASSGAPTGAASSTAPSAAEAARITAFTVRPISPFRSAGTRREHLPIKFRPEHRAQSLDSEECGKIRWQPAHYDAWPRTNGCESHPAVSFGPAGSLSC